MLNNLACSPMSNNHFIRSIAIGLLLLACQLSDAVAQDGTTGRYRLNAFTIGETNLLDTYLTPEEYKGLEMRLLFQSYRTSRHHKNRHYILTHQGHFAYPQNRAESNNMIAAFYHLQYAWRWHKDMMLANNPLHLEGGVGIEATMGYIHNTRNSNNPVQAKVNANIVPTCMASYPFHVRNKEWRVNYEVAFPLAGLMFSPNYGQSYYEIFGIGDYDHNIVATSLHNRPSLRHALTIDIPIRKVYLRMGYFGDYQQEKVNGLKFHNYSHQLFIGYLKNL